MSIDLEFQEKVKLAKLATLNKKHFAFIGSLLYKLKLEPTTDVKHILLDGQNNTIKVNPTYFNNLSPEHGASILAEQVLHYSLQHDIRRGNKIHSYYQKACDQVVRNMLMDFGFKLPLETQVDRRFQNKSVDIVYKDIYIENQNNPNNNGNDINDNLPPSAGDNDLPEEQPELSNNQMNQRNRDISQADMANKAATGNSIGNSSSSFQQLFEEIHEGKLNWKQILLEHFNEISKGDPSYHDLDRRMLSMGLFEPVNEDINSIHRIALALDVSGSVSEEQIKIFLQEIKAIAETLNPEIISVMTFNTKVVDVFEFKQGECLDNIKLNIGGGTAVTPVFKHYNKPENMPEFLLVFSDLELDDYPDKPKYHTTWLCFDNKYIETVPFGKLIHVNSKELK